MSDLIERLRSSSTYKGPIDKMAGQCREAVDMIEAQQAEIERLREALATIASEMEYPNPLECGFVHSRMNLKDAAYRVDIAKTLAMHTLSAQPDEQEKPS